MTQHYDAVISGSGLVGASVALGLADRGWKIAIIEPTERSKVQQPSHDERTLVLNAASINIIRALGLSEQKLGAIPIYQIVINRHGGLGHLHLDATDYRRWIEKDTDKTAPYFGQVIVARRLGEAMLHRLANHKNISEYCPQSLGDFHDRGDFVEVEMKSGQTITGRLLIGADGTHSNIRQALPIQTEHYDYLQSAMVFNVGSSQPKANTAFERFTPQGPLALLPQAQGRFGVVWIDTHSSIDQLMAYDDATLLNLLQQRFGSGLGDFFDPSPRARYPLIKQHSLNTVAGRVVVVGNAANTVHPVSAQGFNLGLRDAAGLIDALTEQVLAGDKSQLDVPHALLHYQATRLPDQQATCRYTDTLARTFAHPVSLVRAFSGLGLAVHAASPTLRRRLVRAAMGFRDPVPSLAQAATPISGER